jgi:hypothetical protein
MEQSPSWVADHSSSSQEIRLIEPVVYLPSSQEHANGHSTATCTYTQVAWDGIWQDDHKLIGKHMETSNRNLT